MRTTVVGRADLAHALHDRSMPEDQILQLLGFRPIADRPKTEAEAQPAINPIAEAPQSEAPRIDAAAVRPIPFWRAERFTARAPAPSPSKPATVQPRWQNRPAAPPALRALAPWRDLAPRLRAAMTAMGPTADIDVERAAEALGLGRPIEPLPRRTIRRSAPRLHVVVDRADRLIPFWDDQELMMAMLRRRIPRHRLSFSIVQEASSRPMVLSGDGRFDSPAAGDRVLVLGDLGAFAPRDGRMRRFWDDLGREIVASGAKASAMTPCPAGRREDQAVGEWTLISWEREAALAPQDAPARLTRAERLLALVSPAVRIEPGLLRAVRRILPASEADAGTEADVWTHPALVSRSPVAATLNPEAAKTFRSAFDHEPEGLRARVLDVIQGWRRDLPQEIWFEEVLNLSPASQALLPHPDDVEQARRFFEFIDIKDEPLTRHGQEVAEWLLRVDSRASPPAWSEPGFRRAVANAKVRIGEGPPSFPVDPIEVLPPDPSLGVRPYDILQVPGGFIARPSDPLAPPGPGSLVGVVRSANGLIRLDADDPFWASGHPPAWAKRWGWDDHGAWVTFQMGEAIQRMRWIPPGAFLMGSPENEPGRWDDEGPQQSVTIADGFWMFDTPCTQALWTAVMGDNPSRFKGANRPVEQVSFEDATRFIERLNDRFPGLSLSLPSEARWEYACRAGTTTADYAGPLSQADVDRDASSMLDRIAWYHANTGGGSGSITPSSRADPSTSDDDADGGARPVALKAPNAWGLYDTLGNVREWCADAWNENHNGAAADGAARRASLGEAGRVVRGGSWYGYARVVRAAYRYHYGPADRDDDLGFRCARVQSGGDGAAEAAPADRAGRPGAERGRPPGPTGDAGPWLRAGGPPVPPLPGAAARLTTDREILTLERDTRPHWATAMGRDAFGLHADFTVPGTEVTQRMRWIPPGQFAMGSPEDEPGRWSAEGPVHDVTLAAGYWLFDTPCTQALWAAVMRQVPDDREEARRLIRKNSRWANRNAMIEPSYFKTPERPVENVSHEDLWTFIDRLNLLVADLNLTLPSEAEWEYACRAGAETATYAGPIDILGENNAPVLDSIAWYGGNSGVGFELDNGYDSSGWKEKQHDHQRAGTHPVAFRIPNHWGLFDMLGNVWEWCADSWHSDYGGAPTDGSAWIDQAPGGKGEAGRVVRGGSWGDDARNVRAASRYRNDPTGRDGGLGFRCARVQSDSERERRAVRSGPSERSEPAATSGPERAGLASLFQSRKRAPKAPRRKK
jgi:formylglycine-generating enzyme required for sulfatase activity